MVTEALQELRARGFHVRVEGDKLKVSPSPVPPDVAALIKDHRDGLVAVLRGRCPVCGERLRAAIHAERFTYSECGVEPIHYAELVNRTGGKPMGVFTDYAPDGQCARCGSAAETFNGVCENCHAKTESAQAAGGRE